MEPMTVALIVALATVLAAEFVNGWTDSPNVAEMAGAVEDTPVAPGAGARFVSVGGAVSLAY